MVCLTVKSQPSYKDHNFTQLIGNTMVYIINLYIIYIINGIICNNMYVIINIFSICIKNIVKILKYRNSPSSANTLLKSLSWLIFDEYLTLFPTTRLPSETMIK